MSKIANVLVVEINGYQCDVVGSVQCPVSGSVAADWGPEFPTGFVAVLHSRKVDCKPH